MYRVHVCNAERTVLQLLETTALIVYLDTAFIDCRQLLLLVRLPNASLSQHGVVNNTNIGRVTPPSCIYSTHCAYSGAKLVAGICTRIVEKKQHYSNVASLVSVE